MSVMHATPSGPGRRSILGLASAALGLAAAGIGGKGASAQSLLPQAEGPGAQWAAFRDRYLSPEGRIVDTGNQGISHSEGQGYGMLFAEAFDDRPAFERMLGWTQRNLRRTDGLHAWRFRPDHPVPVQDPNNATDGDLYIAWALLRAADRWGEVEWRRLGTQTAQAILRRLVVEVGGRALLLPGGQHFQRHDRVILNPSYYAWPALAALSAAVPDRMWGRVMEDGVQMLRGMRYGRWGLPADWVEVRARGRELQVQPAPEWPARFSFDAVRVPLHLAWAGLGQEPAMAAAANFWNDPSLPVRPAWTDLRTGFIAPYSAPAGIDAVAEVTRASGLRRRPAQSLPEVSRSQDYYSAALLLLSQLALREGPGMGRA